MSTSASSLNWWYIEGSFFLIVSAGRRDAMSSHQPCGGGRSRLRLSRTPAARVMSGWGSPAPFIPERIARPPPPPPPAARPQAARPRREQKEAAELPPVPQDTRDPPAVEQ